MGYYVAGIHMTKMFSKISATAYGKILSSLFLLSLIVSPTSASAAEMSVKMVQLLPVGQNTCAPLQVTTITPYIYDGALNSFDITVVDASYVAIAGSVGNVEVPFQVMTRHADTAGNLAMHLDVASTPVQRDLPITLTLLSAKGVNAPICAAILTYVLQGTDSAGISQGSGRAQYPDNSQTGKAGNISAENTSTPGDDTSPSGSAEADMSGWDNGTNTVEMPVMTQMRNSLDKACAVPGGATRLWTVLLVVYMLLIAAAIVAEPSTMSTKRSSVLLAVAILLPLLLLLGVWRISSICSMNKWALWVALLMAVIAFAIGFRNHPRFSKLTQIFTLPEG